MTERDSHTSSSSPPFSISSSTRSRYTCLPKQHKRRGPPSTEDGSQLMQASATLGSSRALLDSVYDGGSSAHLTAATSRRTAERGTRRGLTSRYRCFL
jgi:hypothetical protein